MGATMIPLRATGLLIIEVRNSNPESTGGRTGHLRQRFDGRGEISPFSLMRAIRDLVDNKKGPVWCDFSSQFSSDFDPENFYIFERRKEKQLHITQNSRVERLVAKYWDLRIFGWPHNREESKTILSNGAVQFGLGVSVAPVVVEHLSEEKTPVMSGGKAGKGSRADDRIVVHGVYALPFFVNPTSTIETGCRVLDIDLLLKTIPYVYAHTATRMRPAICIRHAWYIEHTTPLGYSVDFDLLDAMTPTKRENPEQPSIAWDEYDVPVALPQKLQRKVRPLRDLVSE